MFGADGFKTHNVTKNQNTKCKINHEKQALSFKNSYFIVTALTANAMATSNRIAVDQQAVRNVVKRDIPVKPVRSHHDVATVRALILPTASHVQNGWRKNRFKN